MGWSERETEGGRVRKTEGEGEGVGMERKGGRVGKSGRGSKGLEGRQREVMRF